MFKCSSFHLHVCIVPLGIEYIMYTCISFMCTYIKLHVHTWIACYYYSALCILRACILMGNYLKIENGEEIFYNESYMTIQGSITLGCFTVLCTWTLSVAMFATLGRTLHFTAIASGDLHNCPCVLSPQGHQHDHCRAGKSYNHRPCRHENRHSYTRPQSQSQAVRSVTMLGNSWSNIGRRGCPC